MTKRLLSESSPPSDRPDDADLRHTKKARNGEDKKSKREKKLAKHEGVEQPNGAAAEPEKPSKEERREKKRLKKLRAERQEDAGHSGAANGEAQTLNGHEIEGSDAEEKEAKAARKAEKAKRKAEKKAREEAKKFPTSEADVQAPRAPLPATNGTSLHPPSKPISSSASYTEDAALTALPQSDIDAFLSTNHITITDPLSTSSNTLRPITAFSHLPSSAATSTSSPSPFTTFSAPTPIQSAAWPFLLSKRDVIGVAETGSGKTLAFAVPCIRFITSLFQGPKPPPGVRSVMVSPTRELAMQIYEQIVKLAKPVGIETVCVYGGVPKEEQRRLLRKASIVVATPGRLNDLISEGYADLSKVGYLVLDEADRMLDKGFEEAIRQILTNTPSPPTRQTAMFTATWPPSVVALASTFLAHPVKITIAGASSNPTGDLRANTSITQIIEVIEPYDKESRLLQLLKRYHSPPHGHPTDRILVFCLYKKEATRIENFLASRLRGGQGGGATTAVVGIHGDLSQEKRSASLEAFRKGSAPVLVATDVAARGLDIPEVKVVINVTFPLTVEDYVHRIGRTGRAGSTGLAHTLFTLHDKAHSGALINVLRAAGQPVPDDLLKFGTTVKRKEHSAYGAFYKDTGEVKKATKIVF
ncbi:MAG: RNA-dependent ATPase [Caeruleum heppii]|nr:MAG: RNA-dependent ATPase [Caeruleum heppii]